MSFGFYVDPYQGAIENPFTHTIVAGIARACHFAWERLPTFSYRDSTPFEQKHYLDERELNKRMIEVLNYLLDHEDFEWFSGSIHQVVIRDARQVGADLDDDEQSPDLTFRLSNYPPGTTREGCALFVECKVLDTEARNVTNYVKSGVVRFVDGKYAPHMPIGMMLAYVAGGQTLPSHLDDCFSSSRVADVKRVQPCNGVSQFADIVSPPDVFCTEHARPLVPTCNAIQLLHLWLVPPAAPPSAILT
jgi:hypothetical protein